MTRQYLTPRNRLERIYTRNWFHTEGGVVVNPTKHGVASYRTRIKAEYGPRPHHFPATTSSGPYATAYDYLNEQIDLGFSVKAVAGRIVEHDEYGDSWVQWVHLTTSEPVERAILTKAVGHQFAHSCRCEHDCCGHVQSYALTHRLRQVGARRWIVPVSYYHNI